MYIKIEIVKHIQFKGVVGSCWLEELFLVY